MNYHFNYILIYIIILDTLDITIYINYIMAR